MNNNNVADSIDDIIHLLNRHYQPKAVNRTSIPMKQSQVKKSHSVNIREVPQQQPRKKMESIRFLSFKPYSGKTIDNAPDNGYYFKFGGSAVKLIKGSLEENGFKETQDKNWTMYWSSSSIKMEVYQNLLAYQKVNHIPKSYEMTRKDLMHRNISKMQINHGMINFNFIPKTFILPNEMSYFLEEHEKNKGMIYICKPHASCQGRGIFITQNVQDILNKQNSNNSYVVSHYIDRPLLINGLKFDLRVYVAITCMNPLRIYVYEEGLARFATEQYSIDSITKKYGHLTNYAVNKESPNFISNSDTCQDYNGSKWGMQSLREYLKIQKIDDKLIFDRMEDMIIKTVLSVESILFQAAESFRNNCFSLFGFDILIDQQLKPWLLEVNLSPSLNIDAPIDLKIKGELIADLFTLIGIVPLDQRFSSDAYYVRNINSIKNQAEQERYIIKETEDEVKRGRKWKMVYPNQYSFKYVKFFESDRHFNAVLRNYYK